LIVRMWAYYKSTIFHSCCCCCCIILLQVETMSYYR